mmetsp:Transcript_17734/g.25026  ORF Transcript_17734/g.25026 Transcript_17734/m.25026 type:complete len:256 (-) Transcript_17734:271-1038(-)|eukprot:CAMPEP_0184863588 /NCGR_PEP_ID=MMETSP0580-20130426/11749_1 /TAXON_ID=1118495 /ORGANISM="Dactyliosolen fragilissimus" /LENGTH=255 /DNA_ID=CAMNT_0027362007 /DNA_START=94 /DNA_END=861 /DNA_ORIENTATION=+
MADDDFNEQRICKVYDVEDSYTSWVQILLAFLALASLYFKRLNETPRRTLKTWALDVSKQGFGATYAHIVNMLIAAVISDNVRGDYVLEDQCAWYAINFLIDTTLGLVLSIAFLRILSDQAEKRDWVCLKNTGVYCKKDTMKHWIHQLLAWLGILSIVKVILLVVLWVFSPLLAVIGDFLFQPLQGNIRFELLFVMILFPGILNMFYFWIADHYLKAGAEHNEAHESEIENEEIEDEKTEDPITKYTSYEGGALA